MVAPQRVKNMELLYDSAIPLLCILKRNELGVIFSHKRNEVRIHAIMGINLENSVLNETSHKRPHM